MKPLTYRWSTPIAVLLALTSAACVPSASLSSHSCPCVTGWVCCPSTNMCVQEGASCGTTADAGSRGVITDGGMTSSDALPPPGKTYFLTQTRNIASPLPDPTGIASDPTGFWLFNGATLIHFDPTTGQTDRTFTFPNLAETLGSAAYGITWDGSAVWISVAGNTNKLVRVDPTTGQITRTQASPTELGPSDLDFDGTNLWLASGTGTTSMIDPASGSVLRHFTTDLHVSTRDNGIAVRPGELWIGGLFGGIEVDDPANGQTIAMAVHDDGSPFQRDELGSSCFVGDQLVIASRYGITTFRPSLAPHGGLDGGPLADGGTVCPAFDAAAACPATDSQCRATWADVLANPICWPLGGIETARESRFDCGDYHVSQIVHVDTSSTYYYDGTGGQLVAIYQTINLARSCVVGPSAGVTADCPGVPVIPVCH